MCVCVVYLCRPQRQCLLHNFFRLSWSVEVSLPTLVRSGEQGEQGSVPLVPCSWQPNGCGAHEEWLKVFTSMDSISTPCKALAASKNSSVKENKLNRNRGSPARHCKGTSSCYLPTNPFPFLAVQVQTRAHVGRKFGQEFPEVFPVGWGCLSASTHSTYYLRYHGPPCFKPVFSRARSSLASSY